MLLTNLLTTAEVGLILAEYRRLNHDRWPDMDGIIRESLNDLPSTKPVHQRLLSVVRRKLPSLTIEPSYTFTSSYEPFSTLPPHTDRPTCDLNISVALSATGGDPRSWPLYVRMRDVERIDEYRLGVGDGALYRGTKELHWRPMMPYGMTEFVGVFFHFHVD